MSVLGVGIPVVAYYGILGGTFLAGVGAALAKEFFRRR